MSDLDQLAQQAYSHPQLRKELEGCVRRAMSNCNLQGDSRRRMNALQKQAERLSKKIRGFRREYEMYLYQAIGRKVDFEVSALERGDGVQYNVVSKYIVQKDTTEPLAPRFYMDVRVAPSDDEFESDITLTLNAGFVNAIGMRHAKFTQEGFAEEKLKNPTNVFGWIEYLDGDFLKARRLVRPFGNGDLDMGTMHSSVTAAVKDMDLAEDARTLLYTISDTMPDSEDVRWALFTFGTHTLATFLDHAGLHDVASLVRQKLLLLVNGVPQKTIKWVEAMVDARELINACEVFRAAFDENPQDLVPTAANSIGWLGHTVKALGYDSVADGLYNCAHMIS